MYIDNGKSTKYWVDTPYMDAMRSGSDCFFFFFQFLLPITANFKTCMLVSGNFQCDHGCPFRGYFKAGALKRQPYGNPYEMGSSPVVESSTPVQKLQIPRTSGFRNSKATNIRNK